MRNKRREPKDEDATWDTVEELPNDPRIGKKSVLFVSPAKIRDVWNHQKDHPLFKQERTSFPCNRTVESPD